MAAATGAAADFQSRAAAAGAEWEQEHQQFHPFDYHPAGSGW